MDVELVVGGLIVAAVVWWIWSKRGDGASGSGGGGKGPGSPGNTNLK